MIFFPKLVALAPQLAGATSSVEAGRGDLLALLRQELARFAGGRPLDDDLTLALAGILCPIKEKRMFLIPIKGGGHAMAAGVTLPQGGLTAFRAFLEATLAPSVEIARRDSALKIDGAISAGGVTPGAGGAGGRRRAGGRRFRRIPAGQR